MSQEELLSVSLIRYPFLLSSIIQIVYTSLFIFQTLYGTLADIQIRRALHYLLKRKINHTVILTALFTRNLVIFLVPTLRVRMDGGIRSCCKLYRTPRSITAWSSWIFHDVPFRSKRCQRGRGGGIRDFRGQSKWHVMDATQAGNCNVNTFEIPVTYKVGQLIFFLTPPASWFMSSVFEISCDKIWSSV